MGSADSGTMSSRDHPWPPPCTAALAFLLVDLWMKLMYSGHGSNDGLYVLVIIINFSLVPSRKHQMRMSSLRRPAAAWCRAVA